MKKIVLNLMIASILTSLLLVPVFIGRAQTDITVAPDIEPLPALDRIVNVVFTVLLVFAALMIIAAAYQFLTAGGDSGKVADARDRVMYALIGVVIAFLARGMVNFIDRFIANG